MHVVTTRGRAAGLFALSPLLLALASCPAGAQSNATPADALRFPIRAPLHPRAMPVPERANESEEPPASTAAPDSPKEHDSRAANVDSVDLDASEAMDLKRRGRLGTILRLLGQGYNSFADDRTGNDCVSGTAFGPEPSGFAPSYSIQLLQSMEQFDKETSVEASVEGSFKAFSAQVHSKFEQATSSTKEFQFLLVRERVIANMKVGIEHPKLTYALPETPSPKQMEAFHRRCGDQYVSEVAIGAEYLAVVKFASSLDKTSSTLEIDASASGWNVTASANFKQKLSDLQKQSSVEVTAMQSGGSSDGFLPQPSVDDMLTYALKFPKLVTLDSAAAIAITPTSYLNLNVEEADFADSLNDFHTLQGKLFQASNTIDRYRELQARMVDLGVPNPPRPGDIADLTRSRRAALEDLATKMSKALQACRTGFWVPDRCKFDPAMLAFTPPQVGPFIVRKIETTSASPVNIQLDRNMRLEFRGDFCVDGSRCLHDGIGNIGAAYISVNGRRSAWNGAPMTVGPGRLILQVMDSQYDDNGGALYAVVY